MNEDCSVADKTVELVINIIKDMHSTERSYMPPIPLQRVQPHQFSKYEQRKIVPPITYKELNPQRKS